MPELRKPREVVIEGRRYPVSDVRLETAEDRAAAEAAGYDVEEIVRYDGGPSLFIAVSKRDAARSVFPFPMPKVTVADFTVPPMPLLSFATVTVELMKFQRAMQEVNDLITAKLAARLAAAAAALDPGPSGAAAVHKPAKLV